MARSPANRYMVGGKTFVADPQAKLGAGSEGTVFVHPDDPTLCDKLFHPPDPTVKGSASIAQYRDRKISYICRSGPHMGAQFLLPLRPTYDPSGLINGYQMRRALLQHEKLMRLLADSTFRASHQFGLRKTMRLFSGVIEDLALIHQEGLVIGDVNLGCIMFTPDGERVWVDTDSWSYPGFPCLATTELYAHPDLYTNLAASDLVVVPTAQHDQFAFVVMLTQLAIPGAHPFRMGSHPTVKGLQNRTREGITIFDSSIAFPAMLGSPEVLSDDLLSELIDRLKRRREGVLDPAMLQAFAEEVVSCKSCSTEYHASRRQCPRCQAASSVHVSALANFVVTELFKASGTLLFAQQLGSDLYLVCRTGTQVEVIRVDEHGEATRLTPALPDRPGARFRFFANCLVVCPNPTQAPPATLELYRIEHDRLQRLDDTSTGVLQGNSAVFATSRRYLYRTAGNALMRCELFGQNGRLVGTTIGQVHQNQSWFTADRASRSDRDVIFGYDRMLREWDWFIIRGDANGHQYHSVGDLGLRNGETVEDFAVYFAGSAVLLAMVTSLGGRDYARFAVIGLDGQVRQNRLIETSDPLFALWANPRGKLFQGTSVLHVTTDGIVKHTLANDICQALAGTEGQLTIDDQLIRLDGKVGIARRDGLSVLASKKGTAR